MFLKKALKSLGYIENFSNYIDTQLLNCKKITDHNFTFFKIQNEFLLGIS